MSNASLARRDSRPRGGATFTATTGDTRPARHAGSSVATATASSVPSAIRRSGRQRRRGAQRGRRGPLQQGRGQEPRGAEAERDPRGAERAVLGD